MLSTDDLKNLITLLGRVPFSNLAEAKVGVVLEAKLKAMLTPPLPRPTPPPVQEPDKNA